MPDLQSFLSVLEREHQLATVRVEVDPELEITEIATRVVKERGPALLFERVKGSGVPLAINLLGSERRIELALGRHPQQVGAELKRLMEAAMPPRPKKLLDEWRTVGRVLAMSPRRVKYAACQAVEEVPDLARLPVLKCWPKDAGRFVTCGMVLTHDPDTDARNLGIYRMQVIGPDQVLMHWQIQKGGGFHYWKAEQQGKALAVAVVIGGDPIYYLAAVAPLPEGIDELAFAGFLRGKPVPLVYGKTKVTAVPADAEIILEGVVPPDERMPEGPFGDHFGHYSHPAPFPVMWIQTVTRRQSPVYQAAVVGKPPQEDRYIGDAVQEMMLPMIRLIHPELRDIWAYYEAGFHSLAVASVHNRFGKEGMKTALGLLGTGQMALTKCVVLVDADVDARDFSAVLRAIREHFDPSKDFLLLPGVPFDTLDFTSLTLNLGSKMVLDATRNGAPSQPAGTISEAQVTSLHPRIKRAKLLERSLLAVQVAGEGREVVKALVAAQPLAGVPLIAVVSEDVNLEDRESLLWGIFTRFDPARDLIFTSAELNGAWPVYRGRMGIDATFKTGYPDPVVMDPAIIARVDQRWHQYWNA
ncbi:MAG: menaquinone biosynthesis decarboxylase [Candidatus Omnitrophica bacterium CG11_big_fil_rev_8_21_14_0_20_63_9]|nr:MAG: menaquinone biosynthesis decarboxylase [Candidatus Omnitrophica bacterium CG11_big_fil_rev_8_21_14_0_20_63_9]